MAKIHGFVYLIVGIFVALISYFSDNPSLKLFLYIGFLLGIIGIIKLFITSLQRKKEKPVKHQTTTHKQSAFAKYCQRCGNIVRNFDNFCSKCGQALLHRKR